MLVSRQWANCSVELLWHRPHFSDFKKYEAMVAAIQDQNAFYPYPQLIKRLNLTPIAMEANDGSMKPLGLCTKLERLTLTGCMNLTDSPLMEILASNPRIQALDMSQLQNITDISINVVVQHCPRLQGLNVAGCRRITDASMVPLSQHCKLLRRVNFLRLPFFRIRSATKIGWGIVKAKRLQPRDQRDGHLSSRELSPSIGSGSTQVSQHYGRSCRSVVWPTSSASRASVSLLRPTYRRCIPSTT